MGRCTNPHLEGLGHPRHYGMADTNDWSLHLRVRILCSPDRITLNTLFDRLHATPMFLIASYAPAFYKVNAYFHPSQW
jgi:hypothetical protein